MGLYITLKRGKFPIHYESALNGCTFQSLGIHRVYKLKWQFNLKWLFFQRSHNVKNPAEKNVFKQFT